MLYPSMACLYFGMSVPLHLFHIIKLSTYSQFDQILHKYYPSTGDEWFRIVLRKIC